MEDLHEEKGQPTKAWWTSVPCTKMWIPYDGLLADSDTNVRTLNPVLALFELSRVFCVESGIFILSSVTCCTTALCGSAVLSVDNMDTCALSLSVCSSSYYLHNLFCKYCFHRNQCNVLYTVIYTVLCFVLLYLDRWMCFIYELKL